MYLYQLVTAPSGRRRGEAELGQGGGRTGGRLSRWAMNSSSRRSCVSAIGAWARSCASCCRAGVEVGEERRLALVAVDARLVGEVASSVTIIPPSPPAMTFVG
jgi:hypothetical protein